MYQYNAVITNVVDGDTFDATVDLGFHVKATVRFRLYGVDTSEKNSHAVEERNKAATATEFVKTAIGKSYKIETFKTDKYGRWLAKVNFEDGTNLSDLLIEAGLAKPYFGGTK